MIENLAFTKNLKNKHKMASGVTTLTTSGFQFTPTDALEWTEFVNWLSNSGTAGSSSSSYNTYWKMMSIWEDGKGYFTG